MSTKRRAWRDGARARIAGWAYATNPYAPGPKPTFSYRVDPRGRAWSDGYWWAHRNRMREAAS